MGRYTFHLIKKPCLASRSEINFITDIIKYLIYFQANWE